MDVMDGKGSVNQQDCFDSTVDITDRGFVWHLSPPSIYFLLTHVKHKVSTESGTQCVRNNPLVFVFWKKTAFICKGAFIDLRCKAVIWRSWKLVSWLVSYLVLLIQSTTKNYIRAEGDFHEEIYIWKDQSGRERPEKQSEKAKSCWEHVWNEIQLKGP